MKKKYVSDFLAAPILFIYLSSLYGPLGVLSAAPSSRVVSIALMSANLIYILLNFRETVRLTTRPILLGWITFIWLAPVSVLLVQYALSYNDLESLLFWGGVITSNGLLFVVALLFSMRNTRQTVGLLYLASFAGALVGFCLNLIDYGFVRTVLVFISSQIAPSLEFSRMIGFFPHPNEAAITLVMYAAIFLLTMNLTSIVIRLLILVMMFGLVFLTGSRTSLLIGVLLTFGMFLRTIYHSNDRTSFLKSWAQFIFIGIIVLAVSAILLTLIQLTPGGGKELGLDRLSNLIDTLSGARGAHDDSYQIRAELIRQYSELIFDQPLTGYGPKYIHDMIDARVLLNVSQISWIQWVAEYGAPYAAFGAVMFSWTIRRAARPRRRGSRLTETQTALLLFMSLLLVATLSLVDIFFMRSIVITAAVFIGDIFSSSAGFPPTRNSIAASSRMLPRPRGRRLIPGSHLQADDGRTATN